MDDYNDPVHLERFSTMNFIQIDDLGSIPRHGMRSQNYTLEDYRINDWYLKTWMPHTNKKQDGITTYQVCFIYIGFYIKFCLFILNNYRLKFAMLTTPMKLTCSTALILLKKIENLCNFEDLISIVEDQINGWFLHQLHWVLSTFE